MGAVQNRPCRDQALPMTVFADIFPASEQPVTAQPSAFGTDKTIRPSPLKQIRIAGFLRLKLLPELLEAHAFFLAHLHRHPSSLRLFYQFYSPIIRYYILGLVDLLLLKNNLGK